METKVKNLIKKSVVKSKVSPIIDGTFAVIDNQAVITDFENTLILNNIDMDNGVYDSLFIKRFELEDFPKVPELESEKIINTKLDISFADKLFELSSFVGKDEMRPVMTGICLSPEHKCLCATNAHILRTIEAPELKGSEQVVLPAIQSLKWLKSIIQTYKSPKLDLLCTQKYTSIKTEDFEIIIRNIDGKYPTFHAVIPENYTEYKHKIRLAPDTMKIIDSDIKDIKKIVGGGASFIFALDVDFGKNIATYRNIDFGIEKVYPIEVEKVESKAIIYKENTGIMMPLPNDNDADVKFNYELYKKAFSGKSILVGDSTRALLLAPESKVSKQKKEKVKTIAKSVSGEAIPEKVKKVEVARNVVKGKVEVNASIQIVDYSEKAFAVVGDTKIIKDKLKELGGRYNKFLTCGAGWIFSKRHLEVVNNSLFS